MTTTKDEGNGEATAGPPPMFVVFRVQVRRGWSEVHIPVECPDEERWGKYVWPAILRAANEEEKAAAKEREGEPSRPAAGDTVQ